MSALRTAALAAALAGLLLSAVAPSAVAQPIANVNGKPIDQAALYEYMLKRIGYTSLESLILVEVVRQEAEKRGIAITEKEIDDEIARKRELLDRTAVQTGMTFDVLVASSGQTPEMYRDTERTLLMLKRMVQDKVKVTDDDIRDRYQRSQSTFLLHEAMRVSFIRFDDARKATEVRQDIIAGKVKFEDAVRQYSTDPFTKDQGGKLADWLARGQTPFLKAAFALLEDGDLSDLVPWPGMGLYLIRRDRYVRDYQLDFDEVKDDLRSAMTQEATSNLMRAKQDELIKAAKIEILVQWPPGSILPPPPEQGASGTSPGHP